jgi:hypothetical protein
MSDITVINDSQQSELVTNGLAKNGELYLKAAGSTDAGALVVYDSGSWRTFADEAVSFVQQYSLSLDGTNDHVSVGSPSSLDITGDMTLSIWAKFTNASSSWMNLFEKRSPTSGRQYLLYLRNDTGGTKNISFQTQLSGGSIVQTNTSSRPCSVDTWHHIAVVVNSGVTNGTNIYVDGNVRATATHTVGSHPTAIFRIGTEQGSGNFFEGLLDEAAVFNSALSTSDVATLYNSGVPGDISSLSPLGWWRMGDNDSGAGTTITDQGSGGNDGTLVNGPTFSTDIPS